MNSYQNKPHTIDNVEGWDKLVNMLNSKATGSSGGAGHVAQPDPPDNTDVLWIDTDDNVIGGIYDVTVNGTSVVEDNVAEITMRGDAIATSSSNTNTIAAELALNSVKAMGDAGFNGLNQLVQNGNFADTSGWSTYTGTTLSVSANVATVTAANAWARIYQSIQFALGHKYYWAIDLKLQNTDVSYKVYSTASDTTLATATATTEWQTLSGIFMPKADGRFQGPNVENQSGTPTWQERNHVLIDLTAMFGAGNEPTLEQFKRQYTADYYPTTPILSNPEQNAYMLAFDGFISPEINGIRNYWDGTSYHRQIARVDLGSLNWYRGTTTDIPVFYAPEVPLKASTMNIKCTKYATVPNLYNKSDKHISAASYFSSLGEINVFDSAYTTVGPFKQAVSGVFLYYELATEQVLTIDASGLRYDLLWENASPTSEFPAQTISINLTGYSKILVVFSRGNSDDYFSSLLVENITSKTYSLFTANRNWLTPLWVLRNAKIVSSGIQFEGGYGLNLGGSSLTANDIFAIPQRIYGIR